MNEIEKALRKVIMAWEELPGNQQYSPREIERWLSKSMKPALDQARKTLGLPIPQ